MQYLRHYVRERILLVLGIVGFLFLLTHKSEFPVVFNRYSMSYTIMLILAGINLGLLWRLSVLRVSYRQMIRRLSGRPLLPTAILILFLSVVFLIDFLAGFPRPPSDWVNLALLMGILIQAEGLRTESGQLSGHLALFTAVLVLMVILSELMFVVFLAETLTPKNQLEFLRLMSLQWPEPIPVTKQEGTLRILGLSDSFGTAGDSFNYHYVLEERLRQSGVSPIELINVSVPAYEPKHQLAILRYAMAYSPDLVLHGFFVGNDFSLSGREMYEVRKIPGNRREGTSPYRPNNFIWRDWVGNAIEFYAEKRRRSSELRDNVVNELGSISKEKFLKIQFARMNDWGSRSEKNIDRMKSVLPILDSIRAAVEENGARYAMVIHPDQTQVDERVRQQIISTFGVDETEYDFDLPQKVLKSYCSERQIRCLDLLPFFRAANMRGELYLLRDTHYNRTGNELAALTINQFLRENHLIPERLRTTSVHGWQTD